MSGPQQAGRGVGPTREELQEAKDRVRALQRDLRDAEMDLRDMERREREARTGIPDWLASLHK